MKTSDRHHNVTGLLLGAGAILLWSFSATCVVFAGRTLGIWQFLAIASPLASVAQLIVYRLLGRNWRSLTHLPPKLWLATAIGFGIYTAIYNIALVTAQSDAQAVGVSLMNHLWPALTVVLSLFFVPGQRFTPIIALSVIISAAGIFLANGRDILHAANGTSIIPYLLGALAGICWAVYCVLMARWRSWAQHYATSPVGFLMTGTLAAAVSLWRGEWQPLSPATVAIIIFIAFGPWAGGYMFWEMALHRVSISTLGIMGAATPLLSTFWLLLVFYITSATPITKEKLITLSIAALMISFAVLLARIDSRRR